MEIKSSRVTSALLFSLLAAPLAFAQPQVTVTRQQDGVVVKTLVDTLRITVCSPTRVHVVASPDGQAKDATPKQPWMVQSCAPGKFTLTMPESAAAEPAATLDTGSIKVLISLDNGVLEFTDERGRQLLQEFGHSPRSYHAVTVNGESLYQVSDRFLPEVREGLYGLGQHQNGVFNYRGTVVELAQANSDVAVPFLVSTNGYGIFWTLRPNRISTTAMPMK